MLQTAESLLLNKGVLSHGQLVAGNWLPGVHRSPNTTTTHNKARNITWTQHPPPP